MLLHPSDQRDFEPNDEAALESVSASSTCLTRSCLQHAFLTARKTAEHSAGALHLHHRHSWTGTPVCFYVSFKIILQHFKAGHIRAEGFPVRKDAVQLCREQDASSSISLTRNHRWLQTAPQQKADGKSKL